VALGIAQIPESARTAVSVVEESGMMERLRLRGRLFPGDDDPGSSH
jgi:hypothetical protein